MEHLPRLKFQSTKYLYVLQLTFRGRKKFMSVGSKDPLSFRQLEERAWEVIESGESDEFSGWQSRNFSGLRIDIMAEHTRR